MKNRIHIESYSSPDRSISEKSKEIFDDEEIIVGAMDVADEKNTKIF